MISPSQSSCIAISTFMTGSSSLHSAFRRPSLRAARAASSKASIDIVIGAVGQRHLQVNHRKTGNHTGFTRAGEALLDAGDELQWYGTADDLALEVGAQAGLRDQFHAGTLS